MRKHGSLGMIFTALFGMLILIVLIVGAYFYWYEIVHVPFNPSLFIGIAFICVPIAISLILQPFSEKISASRRRYVIYGVIYSICLISAIICAIFSFGLYWDAIMVEMDEPIYVGAISLYLGGFIWLSLVALEYVARSKNQSILFGENTVKNHSFSIRKSTEKHDPTSKNGGISDGVQIRWVVDVERSRRKLSVISRRIFSARRNGKNRLSLP